MNAAQKRRISGDALFLGLTFLAIALVRVAAKPLLWTGDEPRYAFQALGLFTNHAYYPTQQEWSAFVHATVRSHVAYFGALARPYNTVAPCALYGPFLAWFGLEGARRLSFSFGCAGLAAIYYSLNRAFGGRAQPWQIRISVLAIALCIPLLPYMQLIYPEALLFLMVALTLFAFIARRPWLTLLCAAFLPFVHARAFPLACAFAIVALIDTRRDLPAKITAALGILYVLAFALFVVSQFAIFGSFTGGAFSMYNPSLLILPERLGMQLFDVRHGLLAYSPLTIAAFAGLAAGLLRKERLCTYVSVLLVVYTGTFVWATADESWTARYWIAALPLLAVGFYYWLRICGNWRGALVLAPAAAVNAVNTLLYIHDSESFLDSRRASVPYSELYGFTHVHLGLYLPIDADPFTLPPYAATIPALLAAAAIAVALLTAYVMVSAQRRTFVAVVLISTFVTPFAAGAGRTARNDTYAVSVPPYKTQVDIRFLKSGMRVRALEFDRTLRSYWSRPDYPSYFGIRCYAPDGTITEHIQPSHAVLAFPVCAYPSHMQIRSFDPGDGKAFYRRIGHVTLIETPL